MARRLAPVPPGTILAFLPAALIGLLAIRWAIVAASGISHPGLALALDSQTPAALSARAVALAAARPPGWQAETAALARRILAAEPISSTAFAIAALGETGGSPRSAALMRAVVARNPREVSARAWLFDHDIRTGQFADAVTQIDAMMRLRPALRFQLAQSVVPLVGEPSAREALIAAIARTPAWSGIFLDSARRDDALAPRFYALVMDLADTRSFSLAPALLSGIVSSALGRGDVGAAREIYWKYVPRSTAPTANLVYDGNFAGADGPPPFNWALESNQSGYAELQRNGDATWLQVRKFGRDPSVFASQALTLAPGAYVLNVAAEAADSGFSGALSWGVACQRDGRLLARVASPEGTRGAVKLSAPLTVGAGCPAQLLALRYDPVDSGGLESVIYRSVAILPARQPDAEAAP